MRRQCEADVFVAVSPEVVWSVVSDVTRVGQWSGECRGCAWVDEVSGLAEGALFAGRNRRSWLRWTRLNEVKLVCRPNTLVWQTLARGIYPDSVEWRWDITGTEGGTRVRESFLVLSMPKIMEWVLWVVVPGHRDRTADLIDDLARLKTLVEATSISH